MGDGINMANVYPTQVRTVDPFESYHSNVVNKLTRMISDNTNCLFSSHAIDVAIDETSSTNLIISTGQCFKDDILIKIEESLNIDISDNDYFLTSSSIISSGYHYVCLEYTYLKAKPAPQARIRILRPNVLGTDERSYYSEDSEFLFLKCVKITYNSGDGSFTIDNLYNYDPENTENKRLFSPLFAGMVPTLPEFNQTDHEAKIVYNEGIFIWMGKFFIN
jgi:hypothetical protein